MFRDNYALCSKIQESEIQHFIQCIEKGRDVRYLQFLQTIMKVDEQPVKRAQDLVMTEVFITIIILMLLNIVYIYTFY